MAEPLSPTPIRARRCEQASVWFTAYPLSLITRPGQSFLGALGDEELWKAFPADRHQGRAHRSGQAGRRHLPAGGPPPASTATSTASARRSTRPSAPRTSSGRCARMATGHGGTIIDDIVPGHTGKGADFRLAEMKLRRLPRHLPHGRDRAGGLEPAARRPRGQDSVNLDAASRGGARRRPATSSGELQRVIFYEPGRQGDQLERDAAGRRRRRRRAPLGLPALLQGGPALDQLARPVVRRHAAGDRRRPALAGRPGLRRRCGWTPTASSASRSSAEGTPAWSEGHPLSAGGEPAHRQHGAQGRRLHLPGAQPRPSTTSATPARPAPDLSYDFVTRPAYQHALVTGDTEFLRLTLRTGAATSASTPPRWCTRCRTTTS